FLLQKEHTKDPRTSLPSNMPSHRSLSSNQGGLSSHSGHSHLLDRQVARNLHEGIRHRILYLSEQLKVKRTSPDENTMSYLKLVASTERHQATHVRWAFERVNQSTSATISHIECRLHQCCQQLLELEGQRPTGPALKAEGGLDNGDQPSGPGAAGASAPEPYLCSRRQQRELLLQRVEEELAGVRSSCSGLQGAYQSLQDRYLTDLPVSLESLPEQRYRHVLVEEQVDGHLQRHWDEIYRFQQGLACTQEKMAYLSYERAKETWVLEAFKSRLAQLEALQQAAQVEVTRGCGAKLGNLYCISSLLLVLTCAILACVATICSCPLPRASKRLHRCTVLMLLTLGALAWRKRHAIATADWQVWIPSGWRTGAKNTRPS
ncbi:PREDICTED: LOW QUALITY PROTEIN: testis-specific protein TEX28, partial [Chinchilla lanigera]|uniref:LOW QUALITY PROTEIN: testis-specific protein TEX28 n=1 Tax=Chinchilla lanigera TaxID=34839 RepID=UPI000697E5DF